MNELQILAYIQNELSAEEKAAFETVLRQNPALAKEVAELSFVHEALVEEAKDKQLKKSLSPFFQQIASDFQPPNPKGNSFFRLFRSPLALAASFFLLVGLAWWLLTPSISMNLPKEIYGSEAAREQAGEDDYVALVQYAKDKENAKAEGLQRNLAEFRRIQATFGKENGARYDTVQLMGADLELKAKEYEKALAYLEKVTNGTDSKMQTLVYQRFTYIYYSQKNCEKAKFAVEKWQGLTPNDAQVKQAQQVIAKLCE